MNAKEAAAGLGVLAAIAAAAIVYDDVKDAPAKSEAEAKADGSRIEHNVYAVKSDKGEPTIYVVPQKDGGVAKLAESPCARRPAGVKPEDCLRRDPRDGGLVDFGDENTMQPGEWVGAGCVRTACVVFAGEEPETGAK